MPVKTASIVAGVRFHKVGKLYHFDSSAHPQLDPGDFVIVETSRGRQMGQIMGFVPPEEAELNKIKAIKAPATPRDMMMRKLWEAKEVGALIDCREIAAGMRAFDGVKFVKADYNYDGSLLTILFTSEETVDTTKLRKRLAQDMKTRVDMRRIGARDAAKLLGEYGACGAPRCCSSFLTDFSPISIKMAKAQGISLNPSEITGMCGRLRCCLVYEYEQYVEANKQLPRRGKRVGTPYGEGKVIDVNPLKSLVTVYVEDKRHELHKDELIPLDELEAFQAKARAGCTKEGLGGTCECGARTRGEASQTQAPPEAQHKPDKPAGQQRQKRKGKSRKRRSRRSNKPRRGQN